MPYTRIYFYILFFLFMCAHNSVLAATPNNTTPNSASPNNASIGEFLRNLEQGNVTLPGTEVTPEMLQKAFPAPLQQLAPFLNLGSVPTTTPYLAPSASGMSPALPTSPVPSQTMPLPKPQLALPAPALPMPTVATPHTPLISTPHAPTAQYGNKNNTEPSPQQTNLALPLTSAPHTPHAPQVIAPDAPKLALPK